MVLWAATVMVVDVAVVVGVEMVLADAPTVDAAWNARPRNKNSAEISLMDFLVCM
jgi:riboflavin biosynthesis pyrimidine reductase